MIGAIRTRSTRKRAIARSVNSIKAALEGGATALAKRALGSRKSRRYAWARWGETRLRAMGVRPLYRYERIEWDLPGHARPIRAEIAGPSANHVLIRSIVSAVSPGTERAHFSAQPNTSGSFPAYPGCSLAGEVIDVGRNVSHLQVGQRVAVGGGGHSSLVVAEARDVFALPSGVTPEEGAFIYLGIICLHGIWRGDLRKSERVAVLGRGVIGQLTMQSVHALGARTIVSVAPSTRHCTSGINRFADEVIATSDDGEEIVGAIGADLTFEASGAPQAIDQAILATRDGGRIVLLGSPRGLVQNFDFGILADRGISLIGAHINTLPLDPSPGRHDYREAGRLFLDLVADGALDVRSLISSEVDPREAARFYRVLAHGRDEGVGAVFRWNALPDAVGGKRVSYWTPPENPGRQGAVSEQSKGDGAGSHPAGTPTAIQRARALRRDASPRLRLAVIGCGGRGGSLAAVISRATERSELALVMDASEPLARSLGEKLAVPWTTSYDAVLSAPRVDGVLICSPHHLHERQAIAAAGAGKHIVVEKPLAPTLDGATRIVRTARDAGVALSMWLGFRYEPQIVKAKQFVESGALGSLLGAQMNYYVQKPAHYSGQEPGGQPGWRGRWETAGGGVLIMNALHYLDWLLYLTDTNVTEVSARYDALESNDEVEDIVALWLRFENGALGTVHAASCATGFYRSDSALVECRLWGTEGHLRLTPPFQFFSSHPYDGKRPELWHTLGPLPASRGVDIEYLDRFAASVLDGTPLEITGDDGVRVQAVVEAAYESARNGSPVAVSHPEQ